MRHALATGGTMRSIVPTVLLVSQVLTTATAQNGGGPPAQFSCYRYFGMGMEVLATASVDDADLCKTNGGLWNLIGSAQACMSTIVTAVPLPVFSQLNTVLSRCNSEVEAASVSACQSLSAQHQSCTAQGQWCLSAGSFQMLTAPVSYFGQAALTTANTASTTPSTSGASPASIVSQTSVPSSTTATVVESFNASSSAATQTLASSTPGQTEQASNSRNQGSNTGLIVGIAIGSAVGTALLIGVLAIFIWRCRRRRRGHTVSTRSLLFRSPSPTLLSSIDNEKCHPSELESPASGQRHNIYSKRAVRSLGGLQEMDAADDSSVRVKEVGVHEIGSSESPDSGLKTWYSSGTSVDMLH